MHHLFVYGTLKKGFPLHRAMLGARYLGPHQTADCHPMFVAGPRFAPMMLNEPGEGRHVRGELYQIDSQELASLDKIESIGKPGNFRVVLKLMPIGGGASVDAWVYMKSRNIAVPAHTGFLDDYQDRRFTGPPHRGFISV